MQADAEHQQDDADLGELRREARIGNETRRVGAHQDAGDEVADQRRQAQAIGYVAEPERKHETDGDGRDERGFVVHLRVSSVVETGPGHGLPISFSAARTPMSPCVQ